MVREIIELCSGSSNAALPDLSASIQPHPSLQSQACVNDSPGPPPHYSKYMLLPLRRLCYKLVYYIFQPALQWKLLRYNKTKMGLGKMQC